MDKGKVKKIVFLGIMLAVAFVLSFLESTLPPLPFLPPGVKLGLSNIVTMYCVYFAGRAYAISLNALKSVFVLVTRGAVAGMLSFAGGMLSVFVVVLLVTASRKRMSYAAVSVLGACMHNVGQYAVASALLESPYLLYYLPLLLVSGVVMGLVTAILLKSALPVFNRIPGSG